MLGYHWRAFFAYMARRTIQPTKDGKNTKRAAQMTVLLRINERQHKTPAMTAVPRSNVPLRMTRVYQGPQEQSFSMTSVFNNRRVRLPRLPSSLRRIPARRDLR